MENPDFSDILFTPRAWNLHRKLQTAEYRISQEMELGDSPLALWELEEEKAALLQAIRDEYHVMLLILSVHDPCIDMESAIDNAFEAHRDDMPPSLSISGTPGTEKDLDADA